MHCRPPHAAYLPPEDVASPHLLPAHPGPGHTFLPALQEYKPPHSDYLPPTPDHYQPPEKEYLPPSPQSYQPPDKEYLPPKLPSYKGLPVEYSPPSSDYLPPPPEYIPPGASYHPPTHEYLPPKPDHSLPDTYHPPSKEYLPPDNPEHAHYQPPQKSYYLPPKSGYKPGPVAYEKPSTGFHPPSKNYLPPDLSDDYIPPPEYKQPSTGLHPPSQNYLPPDLSDNPPRPESIPDIDEGLADLLAPPDKDYLPPPPRGPQFQLDGGHDKLYVPPPPRSKTKDAFTVPDILNSHIEPPRGDDDHYIPPKTKYDVPKNFIRPEDAPPPPPELIDDIDILSDGGDEIEISLEDLESLNLPGLESLGLNDFDEALEPFIGLAKFKDGRKKHSKKENVVKSLDSLEDDRFEKLRVKPGEPQLPPMPTHAPDSAVPLIERLRPEVLAQLRRAQAGGGGGASGPPGFIPGKAGVDYPDFKSIPATDFTCENFILPGFYADTFTSCQVC